VGLCRCLGLHVKVFVDELDVFSDQPFGAFDKEGDLVDGLALVVQLVDAFEVAEVNINALGVMVDALGDLACKQSTELQFDRLALVRRGASHIMDDTTVWQDNIVLLFVVMNGFSGDLSRYTQHDPEVGEGEGASLLVGFAEDSCGDLGSQFAGDLPLVGDRVEVLGGDEGQTHRHESGGDHGPGKAGGLVFADGEVEHLAGQESDAVRAEGIEDFEEAFDQGLSDESHVLEAELFHEFAAQNGVEVLGGQGTISRLVIES